MSAPRPESALTVDVSGGEDWPDGSTTAATAAAHEAYRLAGPEGEQDAEVSLVLSDDAAVRRLNFDWRGKDSATNVLAFPADMPAMPGFPLLLGDVVLARETVAREAREQDKAFEAHLSHLVVHGTLHLLGFDHQTDAGAAAMEAREVEILANLGIADPYAADGRAGIAAPAAE